MRPLIALTTTSHIGTESRTSQVTLGSPYLHALDRVGATPLLLTPEHSEEALYHLLAQADGLMLTGGEDVDPSFYGEEPHPKLEPPHRKRDEMEMDMLAQALRQGMPVLAICRGLQLLNVARGGTLYQDLPSLRPEGLLHEQEAPLNERWHGLRVEEGSSLARIFGTTELRINSFHHQGIHRLGEGLRAVAWAEDGLVEGVEGTGKSWMVGLQWHPERGEADIPGDQRRPDTRLFYEFAEKAREYRRRREEKTG